MNKTVLSPTLTVSNSSDSSTVADAIVGQIKQKSTAQINAVGAGGINEALRAITIAQNQLQSEKLFISFKCQFQLQTVAGKERPRMHFDIQVHRHNAQKDRR